MYLTSPLHAHGAMPFGEPHALHVLVGETPTSALQVAQTILSDFSVRRHKHGLQIHTLLQLHEGVKSADPVQTRHEAMFTFNKKKS